jgi:tetratricopeptide (TPR) repeat protein
MAGAAIGVVALAFLLWYLLLFESLGQAHSAYSRGDYRGALKAAQAHLKRSPGNRRAALLAARCLSRLGFRAQAEEQYRRAGALASGLGDLQDRAMALAQSDQPERAIELYQEILARCPDDALALKRLAAVHMGQKRWRPVLALADQLIAVPDGEVAGQTLAGIAHHELKHYEQAVTACQRVLTIDPELKAMPLPQSLFWNNFALDLLAVGRTSDARDHLSRALEKSQDAGLMELLGLTYFQQGTLDRADQCWRQAVDWDPTNADALLGLGRLALQRNQAAEAVSWLKRAAESSPAALEPLYNLGRAYRLLGKIDDAERCEKLSAKVRAARGKTADSGTMHEALDQAGHSGTDRQGPAR